MSVDVDAGMDTGKPVKKVTKKAMKKSTGAGKGASASASKPKSKLKSKSTPAKQPRGTHKALGSKVRELGKAAAILDATDINTNDESPSPLSSSSSPSPSSSLAISTASEAAQAIEALTVFANDSKQVGSAITARPRPARFDQTAWALARRGKSTDEIAALMDCSPATAEQAAMKMQIWIDSLSDEIRNALANEQVMKGIEGAGKVFQEAQNATTVATVPVEDAETGEVHLVAQTVPDHRLRLDAVKGVAEFADKLSPRGKGNTINIGNTVNNRVGGDTGKSFEQRVRELREKHGLSNAEADEIDVDDASDADDIIDADIIEDEDDEDEDEGDNGGEVSSSDSEDGDDAATVKSTPVSNTDADANGDDLVDEEYVEVGKADTDTNTNINTNINTK